MAWSKSRGEGSTTPRSIGTGATGRRRLRESKKRLTQMRLAENLREGSSCVEQLSRKAGAPRASAATAEAGAATAARAVSFEAAMALAVAAEASPVWMSVSMAAMASAMDSSDVLSRASESDTSGDDELEGSDDELDGSDDELDGSDDELEGGKGAHQDVAYWREKDNWTAWAFCF
eukprot:6189973-Pleurochrysis_carterae.AAC.2